MSQATATRRTGGVSWGTALLESLATPHPVDRYLELVNPMLTVRELRAKVTEVAHPTADSVRLTLRPTRQWRGFTGGQYVRLTVVIDGVRHARCYSPSCSELRADGLIELTVKRHPHGLVSGFLKDNARVGMVVDLSQSDGEFVLPAQRPERVLLISGGSGITPVMSMLRTLCDERSTADITFLHYAYTPADVAYAAELEAIASAHPNVRLVYGFTENGVGDVHGLFDETHLAEAAPWYADAETFLCGPPGLMTAVSAAFEAKGIADRLHTEQFAPPAYDPEAGDAGGDLTFTASGVSTTSTGGTLLDQAEAAGLNPESGCRMGICFSCTRIKTAGCTRNIRTGELHSDPDQEIQLCISVPVGDVAIDL